MTAVLAIATTCWGLLMGIAPIMQIRLILRTRDASGTSITWIVVLKIGLILWLAYGIAAGSAPLIITNVVAVGVGFVLLAAVVVYRRPQSGDTGAPTARH